MEPHQKKKKHREPVLCWVALAGLTVNMFILDGFVRSYGLLYLEFLDLYQKGPQATGVLATIFSIAGLIASPIGGVVGDRFSTHTVLLAGPIFPVCGALCNAFSTSIFMVYVGYALLGIGNGLLYSISLAAVSKIFLHNRSLASGILTSGGSLGAMLFPIFISFVVPIVTVRGVFLIFAGLMLQILVSGFLMRLANTSYKSHTSNIIETVVISNSQSPKTTDNGHQLSHEKDVASKSSDLVPGVALRSAQEDQPGKFDNNNISITENQKTTVGRQSSNCLQKIKKLINLKLLAGLLFYTLLVAGFFAYSMYLPPYAEEHGLNKTQVSLLLTIVSATELISRLATGTFGNFSCINVYLLAGVYCAISGTITTLVPQTISVMSAFPALVLSMVVTGFFAGGLNPLMSPILVNAVGPELVGTAFGLLSISFNLGLGVPPVIFGALKESTGVYRSVPVLCGLSLCLAAIIIQIGQPLPKVLAICKRDKFYKVND